MDQLQKRQRRKDRALWKEGSYCDVSFFEAGHTSNCGVVLSVSPMFSGEDIREDSGSEVDGEVEGVKVEVTQRGGCGERGEGSKFAR